MSSLDEYTRLHRELIAEMDGLSAKDMARLAYLSFGMNTIMRFGLSSTYGIAFPDEPTAEWESHPMFSGESDIHHS